MSYNKIYNRGVRQSWNNVNFNTIEVKKINNNDFPEAGQAANDRVLVSDPSGFVSWAPISAGSIPSGSANTVLIRDGVNDVKWSDNVVLDTLLATDLTVSTINGSAYPPTYSISSITAGSNQSLLYTDSNGNVVWSPNPQIVSMGLQNLFSQYAQFSNSGSMTLNIVGLAKISEPGQLALEINGNEKISGELDVSDLISTDLLDATGIINFGSSVESFNYTSSSFPWPAMGTYINQNSVGSQAIYGQVGEFQNLTVENISGVSSINGIPFEVSSGTNAPSSPYQIFQSNSGNQPVWGNSINMQNMPNKNTPSGGISAKSVYITDNAGTPKLSSEIVVSSIGIGPTTTSPQLYLNFSNCHSGIEPNPTCFLSSLAGSKQSTTPLSPISYQVIGKMASIVLMSFDTTSFQPGSSAPMTLEIPYPSSTLFPMYSTGAKRSLIPITYSLNGALTETYAEIGQVTITIWQNRGTRTFSVPPTSISSSRAINIFYMTQ